METAAVWGSESEDPAGAETRLISGPWTEPWTEPNVSVSSEHQPGQIWFCFHRRFKWTLELWLDPCSPQGPSSVPGYPDTDPHYPESTCTRAQRAAGVTSLSKSCHIQKHLSGSAPQNQQSSGTRRRLLLKTKKLAGGGLEEAETETAPTKPQLNIYRQTQIRVTMVKNNKKQVNFSSF